MVAFGDIIIFILFWKTILISHLNNTKMRKQNKKLLLFPIKGQSFMVTSFCLSLVLATVSMTTTKRLVSEEACWGLELYNEPVSGPLVMFSLKSVSLLYTAQNKPKTWRAWAQRLDCCMSNNLSREYTCSTLSHVTRCKPHTCHEGNPVNPKHLTPVKCADISETLSSDITF